MRQKIKTMLKTLVLDSFIIKTKPRTVELKNNSAEDQTFTFPIGHVTGFFLLLKHHKFACTGKFQKCILCYKWCSFGELGVMW